MSSKSLRERIIELSPAQREILAEQLDKAVEIKDEQTGPQRLVAYVTGDDNLDMTRLLNYAREKLPDYMVPATMVQLTEFPRLPNGKLDFKALSSPNEDAASASGYVPPGGVTELQLAKIWEEVLNFKPVGIHDNFFEIGGDSIISIQIVSRARKAGLTLTPRQVFECQTIAELAIVVRSADEISGYSNFI